MRLRTAQKRWGLGDVARDRGSQERDVERPGRPVSDHAQFAAWADSFLPCLSPGRKWGDPAPLHVSGSGREFLHR